MTDETQPAPAEAESVDVQQPETPQEQPETTPEPKPRRSVRESFEKAFKADLDKAEDTDVTEAPPEDEQEGAQPRGPDGKFVAKDGEKPPEAAEKPEDAKEEKPKDGHAEPPSRFSADAKTEWANAPASVRAEAHRAIKEMETGLAQKDEQIKPLEPFMKMAQDSGISLDQALTRYVNMENMLRQDPAKGLVELARNIGYSPEQLAGMLTGEKAEGQPDPRDQQIQSLQNEVAQLKSNFQGVSQTVQQQREQSTAAYIKEFADANPRFEELSEDIAEMLNTGYAKDLQDAYDKASRMNPAPSQPAPAAEPQSAPAQTRQPKSLTGAPSPGSNPASHRAPSKSPREAIARAFDGL